MKIQLKSGNPSEFQIHKSVMEWIDFNPSISPYIIHVPNEGKRTKQYGYKLKQMGMKRGVFDLFIALPKHLFHGAWIELKSENGRLSSYQNEFMNNMIKSGYFCYVCKSLDNALDIIKWYCFS